MVTMKIVMAMVLALAALLPQELLAAKEFPWKLRKNQDGVTVYTRKVAGSAILEYKATVVVDAPIEKVIALFEDDASVPKWFYGGVHSDVVEAPNPNTKVYYFVAQLDWPVADRDCVFERIKLQDSSTGEITYTLKALPDRLPKKRRTVRVPYIDSIWVFTPLPDGKTKVFFRQHTSPGGSIPSFMSNMLVIDVPFHSLNGLRKMFL